MNDTPPPRLRWGRKKLGGSTRGLKRRHAAGEAAAPDGHARKTSFPEENGSGGERERLGGNGAAARWRGGREAARRVNSEQKPSCSKSSKTKYKNGE
ncbi:hypothetical protein LINPERHAP1_LOCUS4978 [Linum perenne]